MNDLESLLDRTTPDQVDPVDLSALHRRGVRRRRTARAMRTAGTAMAALLVFGGGAALLGGPRSSLRVEPAGPSADTGPVDEVAFVPTEAQVAAAAATLPVRGADLGPDVSSALASQPSAALRANDVACLYADGPGDSAAAPAGGRSSPEWGAGPVTFDDLVAECLDSDSIRSEGWHAPGPFRLCQATLTETSLRDMVTTRRQLGETLLPGSGGGSVTRPAVVTDGTACTAWVQDPETTPRIEVAPLDNLDAFNDRRAVAAAVNAAEADCLSPTQALALADAAADRLDGNWRVTPWIDPSGARSAPCVDVTVVPNWATIRLDTMWSVIDDEVPADAADTARRGQVADDLAAGRTSEALARLDRRGERAGGSADAGDVAQMLHDPKTQSMARVAIAAGCLSPASALDLAWALHDQLPAAATGPAVASPGRPAPDCLQVDVLPTAATSRTFPLPEPNDSSPHVRVSPVWID